MGQDLSQAILTNILMYNLPGAMILGFLKDIMLQPAIISLPALLIIKRHVNYPDEIRGFNNFHIQTHGLINDKFA